MAAGFENGTITFDEAENVYYSGQVIRGNVQFILMERITFAAITIEYHGEAEVSWEDEEKETYNGVTTKKVVEYKGSEQYLNVTQILRGGQGPSHLEPGTHCIPFECQLPLKVPSSFDGAKGNVFYYVKASMDCLESVSKREELEKEFLVVAPLDLNRYDPEVKNPVTLEFEEVLTTCCYDSGLLSISISLPASGFCPGQDIPIHITASNESSHEVKMILFSLVKKEEFHSQDPKSDYIAPEEELENERLGPLLAKTANEFALNLTVPEDIVPNLDDCSIIDISYILKVKVTLSGCNDDLRDETELCLGLVPLVNLIKEPYTHPMKEKLPKAPVPPVVPYEAAQQIQNSNLGANAYPTPYPSQNRSYPPHNQAYPTFNQAQPTYPSPYPQVNLPYPTQNPPYPTVNQTYPVTSPPYPATNQSYPAISTGFKYSENIQLSPYPGSGPQNTILFQQPNENSKIYLPRSPGNPSAPPASP